MQRNNIKTVLSEYESTKREYETHLAQFEGKPSDLDSTLNARLGPFKAIAAAWSHCSESRSIREWSKSQASLVLGDHDSYKQAMEPLNRVVLQLIIEALLDKTTRSNQRTRVILDELQDLGHVEKLPSLLNRGVGLGVTAALGIHDMGSLTTHYGADTNGMIGMCGNFAFLRITNPATAKWASEVIGLEEVVIKRAR